MPPLIWVCKDSSSTKLSRSSRAEESIIRRHVQATRAPRLKAPSSKDDASSPSARRRKRQSSRHLPLPANVPFYSRSARENEDEELEITNLAQEAGASRAVVSAHGRASPLEALIPLQYDPFLMTPHERRSLAFFRARTSHEWSGWLDLEFWNRIVLQLAHASKVVAHSLIALSALHESHSASINKADAAQLRQFSLTQSAKAACEGNTVELNYVEALASCIVLYCLQSFQRPQAAAKLLRSGLNMLTECTKRNSVTQEQASLIEGSLKPIFSRLRRTPCRMNNAVKAFQISSRRHRKCVHGTETSNRLSLRIPKAFTTANQARTILEAILDWGHDNVPLQDFEPMLVQHFHGTFDGLCDQWNAALVESNTMSPPWAPGQARMMRAALLYGRIVIHASLSESEMVFDNYTSEFAEMMLIVEEVLLQKSATNLSFGIDGGLVDIITFVGSKCRDPFIRRRALAQLWCADRIEGDRLFSVPGTILAHLIQAEEGGRQNMSCHDIAKRDRRRILFGQQFFAQRRLRLFVEFTEQYEYSEWEIQHFDVDFPQPGQDAISSTNSSAVSSDLPDVVVGTGYIAYLDDRASKQYFKLQLDKFDFPIPRV